MSWLSQNWVVVVVVVVVAIAWLLLRRGGLGGHSGHGHGRGHDVPAAAPEVAVDPVGGEAVLTANALSSVYEGKIYYFSSADNRARFEAAPKEYAYKVAGHPVNAEAERHRPRRHGGC